MNHRRYDWLADRWVVFSPERAKRPNEFTKTDEEGSQATRLCPFCEGNERLTPDEVLVLPAPSRKPVRWQVRVVPNKYPAVNTIQSPFHTPAYASVDEPSASLARTDPATVSKLLPRQSVINQSQPLIGAHEVIVETPSHLKCLTELSTTNSLLVLEAYQRRLIHWRAYDALRYGIIFKNVGREAGASLSHTHSQLVATDFLPPDYRRLCQRLAEYQQKFGSGYFEDVVEQELVSGVRIVADSETFLAFIPYASILPYFVTIVPKQRQARFEELEPRCTAELNTILRRLVQGLHTCWPGCAYNLVVHTSPFEAGWHDIFHWRIELYPRLTKLAGFEAGSGCYINATLPEVAAAELARAIA